MRGKIYSESEVVLHEHPKRSGFIDKTGGIFGRLTVIGFGGRNERSNKLWFCQCDCGNITRVRESSLSDGDTQSCGCVNTEVKTTHGHTKGSKVTCEYTTWANMLDRIRNSNNSHFMGYGGRGIKVCERWLSFENFIADMGKRPEGTTIDRINNDGDYEPSNCRWATNGEQASNKRSNLLISYSGKVQTAAQWEREIGLNPGIISTRLRIGWDIERALNAPARSRRNKINHVCHAQRTDRGA